jgi:hypothetical protein
MVLSLVAGLPGLAGASIVQLANPNQFTSNATLLTFQGVNAFQNVTSFGGVGFQTLGVGPGVGISGAMDPTPPREFGPSERTILNQYLFGTQGIQLTLPAAESRLAFEAWTFPNAGGKLSIQLFAGGNSVGSILLDNRETAQNISAAKYLFYGIQSSDPFDRVILRGPGDGRISLDNLRFENVSTSVAPPTSFAPVSNPEPSTMSLFAVGTLALLGLRSWRGSSRTWRS